MKELPGIREYEVVDSWFIQGDYELSSKGKPVPPKVVADKIRELGIKQRDHPKEIRGEVLHIRIIEGTSNGEKGFVIQKLSNKE